MTAPWVSGVCDGQRRIYLLPQSRQNFIAVLDLNNHQWYRIDIPCNASEKHAWCFCNTVGSNIYCLPYGDGTEPACVLEINTENQIAKLLPMSVPLAAARFASPVNVPETGDIWAAPYGHTSYNTLAVWNVHRQDTQCYQLSLTSHTKKYMSGARLGDWIIWPPRGEEPGFSTLLAVNIWTHEIEYVDLSKLLGSWNQTRKKWNVCAAGSSGWWCPPYSETDDFDAMLHVTPQGTPRLVSTGEPCGSRKHYASGVSDSGIMISAPAGHETNFDHMLAVNLNTGDWYTKSICLGQETKKYFQGHQWRDRMWFAPRGGCSCEPREQWKRDGDLQHILGVDIHTGHTEIIDLTGVWPWAIEKHTFSAMSNQGDLIMFPDGGGSFHQLTVWNADSGDINIWDLSLILS